MGWIKYLLEKYWPEWKGKYLIIKLVLDFAFLIVIALIVWKAMPHTVYVYDCPNLITSNISPEYFNFPANK